MITEFLEDIKKDVYLEPSANDTFIIDGINSIKPLMKEGDTVLDIGCGLGFATRQFVKDGYKCTGITMNIDEQISADRYGLDVRIMDMHFMQFDNESFNVIWARHCLEHSPLPLYVIRQCYELLKPGGIFYVEVPAPDTCARHETNPNHYSVMGGTMWISLMERAKFKNIESYKLVFDIPNLGKDAYYRFIGRKQ